jgi:hypothetical protein
MWHVNNLEIKPAVTDFSASGKAKREVSQLFSGKVLIINPIIALNLSFGERDYSA